MTNESPHIVSNSEGSAYCDLAAASVLKMDAENEELRQRVQELETLLRECHGHWMCDDNPTSWYSTLAMKARPVGISMFLKM